MNLFSDQLVMQFVKTTLINGVRRVRKLPALTSATDDDGIRSGCTRHVSEGLFANEEGRRMLLLTINLI